MMYIRLLISPSCSSNPGDDVVLMVKSWSQLVKRLEEVKEYPTREARRMTTIKYGLRCNLVSVPRLTGGQ